MLLLQLCRMAICIAVIAKEVKIDFFILDTLTQTQIISLSYLHADNSSPYETFEEHDFWPG